VAAPHLLLCFLSGLVVKQQQCMELCGVVTAGT
jgi:hypothetical protein